MADITIRVEGDAALRAALRRGIGRSALQRFLLRAALTVEGRAKMNAPVDTGRLRASITHRIEPTRAVIGSNVQYAPHVEWGTRPHFPPLAAMQPWAKRHGFLATRAGAYLVARAISRRGTRPRLYLTRAMAESVNDIHGFWRLMADEVRAEFKQGGSQP